MGISKVVKYNFNFLNYIIQFCLIFYYGPFHNSNQNKTTKTNKQKRQAFVVSIPKPKKPISNWFLKSGVPTIKPFLRKKVVHLIPISECINGSMAFHYFP